MRRHLLRCHRDKLSAALKSVLLGSQLTDSTLKDTEKMQVHSQSVPDCSISVVDCLPTLKEGNDNIEKVDGKIIDQNEFRLRSEPPVKAQLHYY